MTQTTNQGKEFWSALNYIMDSFREYGEKGTDGDYGICEKSIRLKKEEWEALNSQFDKLERAITDTWKDASQLVNDLDEIRDFLKGEDGWATDVEDAEAYRKAALKTVENMVERFEDFIDDSNSS